MVNSQAVSGQVVVRTQLDSIDLGCREPRFLVERSQGLQVVTAGGVSAETQGFG